MLRFIFHHIQHSISIDVVFFLFVCMITSCASPGTPMQISITSSSTPTVLVIRNTAIPTDTNIGITTPILELSPTPTSSDTDCPFTFMLPAKVELEILIGSLASIDYKSFTLEISPENNSLQVNPENGEVITYPLSPSVAQNTLISVLAYLCGLESLPGKLSDYPVHSPDWHLKLDIAGEGNWMVDSIGIIVIDNQPYTDKIFSDLKDPASLLIDLVTQQVP